MLTLKVLSALMSYPQADTLAALDELEVVVERERLLPVREHAALVGFIRGLKAADPTELQERYVALFDRGRSLSLHLFEHVHGESRDRGQAMVELMNLYRRNGFEINARELPDYLPLLLEYLSRRPAAEARELLTDAMPVISRVGARLAERDSAYQVLFQALEGFAGAPPDRDRIRDEVAQEGPDEAIVNMDKIWEEEAVTFMANPGAGGCPVQQAAAPQTAPVRWVGRREPNVGSPL